VELGELAPEAPLFALPTEEIDLDAELRKAQESAPPPSRSKSKLKPAAPQMPMEGKLAFGIPIDSGSELMSRCSEKARIRYTTLLFFERQFPSGGDHGLLMSAACQIMESELDKLLVTPARRIAAKLIDILKAHRKAKPLAKILEDWSTDRMKATIGTQVVVLRALEWGREHRMRPILKFLRSHFKPEYVRLLGSKKLAECLDQVRTRFRNPACHGTAVFDEGAYREFARLVVASRLFHIWDSEGPEQRAPSANIGVFHHHLAQAQS
jgi:hypothetical protein